MSDTLITSRDSKGVHAVGLFEAVYNRFRLDDKRAQRLNEHGGELQEGIAKLIAELIVTNQYANEEVASSYTYPREYKGPKPIEEQIKLVSEIFGLDMSHALGLVPNLPELPEGAEGWFAIPSVDALAAEFFPKVTDPDEKQCRAVRLVHEKIAASRRFYNYRDGQITPDRLRVHPHTVGALRQLAKTQKSDILIVAAQFGLRHRGCSVRRAREKFVVNEFGLDTFTVGVMLLTHPEREVRWEQLHPDCSGSKFVSAADGEFDNAPYFRFGDGGVRFGTFWVSRTGKYDGSASGFLPQ